MLPVRRPRLVSMQDRRTIHAICSVSFDPGVAAVPGQAAESLGRVRDRGVESLVNFSRLAGYLSHEIFQYVYNFIDIISGSVFFHESIISLRSIHKGF